MAGPLLASWPMYNVPTQAGATLWQALRSELVAQGLPHVPELLSTPTDLHPHWLQSNLLFSQACGYPLIDDLDGRVQLIGCLHYNVPYSQGIHCRSLVVVRAGDAPAGLDGLRGRRLAYNATTSQSGYNALRALVAPLMQRKNVQGERFFSTAVETGSHAASLVAVRDSLADVACVDCVSYAALQRYMPELLQGLVILTTTAPYPGLPLITSMHTTPADLERLRSAWAALFSRPDATQVCDPLFLKSFEVASPQVYDVCRDMRDQALRLGVKQL